MTQSKKAAQYDKAISVKAIQPPPGRSKAFELAIKAVATMESKGKVTPR